MKSLLLIGFLIATVLGAEDPPTKEQMLAARQACFDEIPVPESYQASILKFEYANEEVIHKYIRCISLKLGNWDDTHGFNVDKVKALTNKFLMEVTSRLTDACLDTNEAKRSPDQWAYDNFMCMENNVFSHVREMLKHK